MTMPKVMYLDFTEEPDYVLASHHKHDEDYHKFIRADLAEELARALEAAGWAAAIAWLAGQRDAYVRDHGIYDPSTGATEFSDGGEYEGSLVDLIEGMQRAAPAASDLISREAVIAPPLPDLALFDPADEDAMNWVFSNLHAIRRDNGNMDYTLKAVVRAYQAGKAAAPAVRPDIEALARQVYASMVFANQLERASEKEAEWVESGNSIAQQEARACVGRILAALETAPAAPAGDLVSREAVIAPPLPDLALFDPADEDAMNWVFSNLHAIRRDNGNMDYTLKAVVRAYQAGKAAAPAVKGLKWESDHERYFEAKSIIGIYNAIKSPAVDYWLLAPPMGDRSRHDTLEAAKAAAQADYEARILAALEGGE